MYIPKQNLWQNEAEIRAFMQANSFATLVSVHENQPIATHIPIELESDAAGRPCLVGHISRGNIQRKSLLGQKLLVIFSGPHSYISSSWYDHLNVPTWNYVAVHVYGHAQLLAGDELRDSIARLVDRYESGRPNRVALQTMPAKFVEAEIKGVVGFRLVIEEIQAKEKLSQNRDQKNAERIIEKLQDETDSGSQEIARLMQERIDHKKSQSSG